MIGSADIAGRLRDERGFTLGELLVSMTIGMVVLLASFALIDTTVSSSSKIQDRVDNVQRGRQAMELMTQSLRSQTCLGPGRPAITQADDNSVEFYADLGPGSRGESDTNAWGLQGFAPDRYRLVYTTSGGSGSITEYQYKGQGNPPNVTFTGYPSTPTRKRVLVTNIEPVPGVAIFRYYAFSAAPVRPDFAQTTPLDGNPNSTAANASARTVRIAISFIAQPTRRKGTVKTTFQNEVYARTSDPTDPDHSPQCN